MLARHVRLLLKEELGVNLRFEKAPKEVTKDLAGIEALGVYHRWLRGVLCYLTIIVFVLSLASLEGSQKDLIDWAMFGASLPAQLILLRIYQIKYQFAGLTDPIYRKSPNLVNSPYFYQMLVEMLVWTVQCPPYIIDQYPSLELLNFMPFFRLYSIGIYLNNSNFAYRTFCRAMAAMCGIPLTTSLYMRSVLIYKSAKSSLIITGSLWVTLSLMYAKAEGQSFSDSVWFIFVTVGTIGYGDISPKSTQGRCIAFLAWVYALVLIGYVVVLTHDTLKLKEKERNLYILFKSNQLSSQLPKEAATAIQRCWRFYVAKKNNEFVFVRGYLAYVLLRQVSTLRYMRRMLREASKRFQSCVSATGSEVQVNSFVGPKRPKPQLPEETTEGRLKLISNRLDKLESAATRIQTALKRLGEHRPTESSHRASTPAVVPQEGEGEAATAVEDTDEAQLVDGVDDGKAPHVLYGEF